MSTESGTMVTTPMGKVPCKYHFSPGDEKKEVEAHNIHTKLTLFCVGATLDFENKTLTNLPYPILTPAPGMTNVDAAPRSAKSSMFGDLLQTTLLEAPSIDPTI